MSQSPYQTLNRRLQRLDFQSLADKQLGIEKESLRVSPNGKLAQSPHPASLGSALTHPWITTDYSEALLELVTPPVSQSWEALQCLVDLHQFVYEQIDGEMLWATSMPCQVSHDADIPIAQYGSSNVGTMKTVYRRGLGHRYGRLMQAIAGVHFNFSVGERFWADLHGSGEPVAQDVISNGYFDLLRNFRRYGWIVLYLFGASPAACRSFLGGNHANLDECGSTLFGRYATSLRMSDVGYKNKVQSRLEIPVNRLDEYMAGLTRATSTLYPAYEQIGVVVDGEYRQLNANILQIENEYYSLIRPKRVARSGEKPTHALARRGVEYVEVRAIDVSPFDPAGINQTQIKFLEVLLIFCLLQDSPPIDEREQTAIDANQLAVARDGRDPALSLRNGGQDVSMRDWALELCEQMRPIAGLFDEGKAGSYTQALADQIKALRDPALTPSARVLSDMSDNSCSFYEFGLRMSLSHREYFDALANINEGRRNQLTALARESHQKQKQIEANDELTFEQFLQRYFAQQLT